jgi:hypothetical protein
MPGGYGRDSIKVLVRLATEEEVGFSAFNESFPDENNEMGRGRARQAAENCGGRGTVCD